MKDLPISGDRPHDEAEALLPWYMTGQLDDDDRARVEEHLQSCVQCQQQVFAERRLIDEFRSLTPQVDNGWARLRAQIHAPEPRGATLLDSLTEVWRALTRPPVMGFVAAQAVFLLLGASLIVALDRPAVAPQYRALGSTPAPASANVIVMFQPGATEQQISTALQASGASLVGGPTSADAYLLHVAPGRRSVALARLHSDRQVTMAQPIDGVG